MTSYIGPITDNILKTCFKEIKKEETKVKIDQYVISPLMTQVYDRCKGIILVAVLAQLLIIVMLAYLIFKPTE